VIVELGPAATTSHQKADGMLLERLPMKHPFAQSHRPGMETPSAAAASRKVGSARGFRFAVVLASVLALTCMAGRTFILGSAAFAQDADGDQAPAAQTPITPATGTPASSSTLAQPLFPQGNTPVSPSAQAGSAQGNPSGPAMMAGLGFGPIHPGDVVEVRFFQAPEYNVQMPVSASGDIAIPYAGIFHIEGLTSIDAAKAITQLFQQRQILRNPHVIVTTQQFGYSVTVLGEVRAPGVYRLQGRHRLIDILTEAGGVTDRAGHIIQVFGVDSTKNPQKLLWDPTLQENNNAGLVLKPGQTVMVSRCGVVYVGGNVVRPGAYPLCDSNNPTLSEVISLALGVRPSSWPQRTLLLRTSKNGTRLVERVRLDDVLRGKGIDIAMQSDDIVFVPPSNLKAASKVMATAALGFATQAYLYLH